MVAADENMIIFIFKKQIVKFMMVNKGIDLFTMTLNSKLFMEPPPDGIFKRFTGSWMGTACVCPQSAGVVFPLSASLYQHLSIIHDEN